MQMSFQFLPQKQITMKEILALIVRLPRLHKNMIFPLWNMWAAMQGLPDHGLDPESVGGYMHLSEAGKQIQRYSGLQIFRLCMEICTIMKLEIKNKKALIGFLINHWIYHLSFFLRWTHLIKM